jgi:hypothetical protein
VRNKTEAEDFRGDEPPDANCQFLLEGEDLQGAEEGEPQRKSQAVKRFLDTVKPGRE